MRTGQPSIRKFCHALHGMCALGLVSLVVTFSPRVGWAAELVMFEAQGCGWCAAWHRDVGGIYHKTPESQAAPLRRVDLDAPRPHDLVAVRGVIYTPTFVLMDQGREVGRIQGYPGVDHFWGLLGILLQELDHPQDIGMREDSSS